MHPDQIDLTAAGSHAYLARLGEREVRITVSDATLSELGLNAVEEPLLVRRTLEQLPGEALADAGPEVSIDELGASVTGYPQIVLALLRN